MADERWLPVAEFPGKYEVSDHGHVRNLRTNTIMSPYPNVRNGYLTVCFWVNNKTIARSVHRLVALAFVPGHEPGLQVCHNDGSRDNNHYENLRWDTAAANHLDRTKHGTNPMLKRTHCPSGHAYAGANLIVNKQGRFCRACKRAKGRKTYSPEVADAIYQELMSE